MPSDPTPEGVTVPAFLDLIPTHLRNASPEAREQHADLLRTRLERRLPAALDRWASLEPIVVSLGPHVALLDEARQLYVHGYFYSCVAQCGITGERILKDLLARHLLVVRGGQAQPLPEEALEHTDYFEHSRIARFLTSCRVISQTVRKAALQLGELRNKYAHGSGSEAEQDALRAVTLLHAIVEGTVSLYERLATQAEGSAHSPPAEQ